jgi:hypothetical protein
VTSALTADAALAAWGALEAPQAEAELLPDYEYKLYRPLVDAIGDFKRDAQAKERIYTGIADFDAEMRGVSAGQLLSIQGHSHSGKTLVLSNILEHNRDKRIAWFIPDEDAPLVLAKLSSLTTGVDARTLEDLVAVDDRDAMALLRKVATETFPNLAVFDRPVDPSLMERGFAECTRAWGAPPQLVVLDFLDQLQLGEALMPKWDFVKSFGKTHNVPMIIIHQTSRSGGADGKKMTISSGSYGGESHATYIIGVRRKKFALLAEKGELQEKVERTGSEAAADRLQSVDHELRIADYTVTVNLVKNKRVGGDCVDDMDLELEKGTGRLTPLRHGDLPVQYRRTLPNRRPQPSQRGWEQTAFDDDYREVYE